MTKNPKPHKIGKGGNPRPAKHINPAIRPDDGRLAAVPTVNFGLRLPVPLLERVEERAKVHGVTPTEVIRTILIAYFEEKDGIDPVVSLWMDLVREKYGEDFLE